MRRRPISTKPALGEIFYRYDIDNCEMVTYKVTSRPGGKVIMTSADKRYAQYIYGPDYQKDLQKRLSFTRKDAKARALKRVAAKLETLRTAKRELLALK